MAGNGGQTMSSLVDYEEDSGFTLGWWGTRRVIEMLAAMI